MECSARSGRAGGFPMPARSRLSLSAGSRDSESERRELGDAGTVARRGMASRSQLVRDRTPGLEAPRRALGARTRESRPEAARSSAGPRLLRAGRREVPRPVLARQIAGARLARRHCGVGAQARDSAGRSQAPAEAAARLAGSAREGAMMAVGGGAAAVHIRSIH